VWNPYVTGSYVTGSKHYGRKELIDHLLHGAGRAYWVVGTRRIGKTSLLRQLELLAAAEGRLVPLYWDMQGSDDFTRLSQYLVDAVWEHAERLEPWGVSPEALPQEDAAELLAALRRAAARAGQELLLLGDETEVLIRIAQAEPQAMQRLHRELTAGRGLRAVLTSTQAIYQLHDVCQDWPTSPFLAGFDMAQALGSLSADSARALIMQAQEAEPVRATGEVIDAICDATNNHPYLLQLLCSRLFQEEGWLRPITADDLVVDQGLRGFFKVDFQSLTEADRQILWAVQQADVLDETALARETGRSVVELHQRVHNLVQLGYLRLVYGQAAIGNQFLANWLATERAALDQAPAAQMTEAAMRKALVSRQAQEASFLKTRLNALRARLVELEAVRARDLLGVAPSVLAEIERLQRQIKQLRQLLGDLR